MNLTLKTPFAPPRPWLWWYLRRLWSYLGPFSPHLHLLFFSIFKTCPEPPKLVTVVVSKEASGPNPSPLSMFETL